jgi:hypothetical protein
MLHGNLYYDMFQRLDFKHSILNTNGYNYVHFMCYMLCNSLDNNQTRFSYISCTILNVTKNNSKIWFVQPQNLAKMVVKSNSIP